MIFYYPLFALVRNCKNVHITRPPSPIYKLTLGSHLYTRYGYIWGCDGISTKTRLAICFSCSQRKSREKLRTVAWREWWPGWLLGDCAALRVVKRINVRRGRNSSIWCLGINHNLLPNNIVLIIYHYLTGNGMEKAKGSISYLYFPFFLIFLLFTCALYNGVEQTATIEVKSPKRSFSEEDGIPAK